MEQNYFSFPIVFSADNVEYFYSIPMRLLQKWATQCLIIALDKYNLYNKVDKSVSRDTENRSVLKPVISMNVKSYSNDHGRAALTHVLDNTNNIKDAHIDRGTDDGHLFIIYEVRDSDPVSYAPCNV